MLVVLLYSDCRLGVHDRVTVSSVLHVTVRRTCVGGLYRLPAGAAGHLTQTCNIQHIHRLNAQTY